MDSGVGRRPTAFFSKTYDEVMGLAEEARDYLAYEEAADREALLARDRLRLALETTRLTSRILHVVAWVLARRAVHVGEISPGEALHPPYRLERRDRLIESDPDGTDGLPPRLTDLIERSARLYTRVARLDEMIDRDGGGAAPS